jgi:hypothetical protein
VDPELVDRMFAKMSMKFEEKYKNYDTIVDGPSARLEETLCEEVMSNTCPVCFEIFLPPSH